MPSTYSDNLQIELIATGEKTGTWGESTNVNLQVIDQSISGVADATLASAGTSGTPNTLAITQGSQSAGRNKFIEFKDGGDLGATAYVDLTPNTSSKIVFVRNSLSGGQSIIFFQGTYDVSRGYELVNGKDAMLVFDGGGVTATVVNGLENLRVGSTSTSGDITVGGDVNATGDVTVGGDSVGNLFTELGGGLTDQYLAKNSNTDYDYKWVTAAAGGGVDWGDIGGTITNQTDLVSLIDNSISAATSAVGHRYWKVLFNPQATSAFKVEELIFRKSGKGFEDSKRWAEGDLLDTTITSGMLSVASENTLSSVNLINMFDGTSLFATFQDSGSGINSSSVGGFDIDFGVDNEQSIGSLSVIVPNDVISTEGPGRARIYFSDDDITYTLASDFDLTSYALSAGDTSPTMGVIYDPGEGNPGDVIFDPTVRTIPPVTGGGGGGLWAWNYTQQSTPFTAVAGTYYVYVDDGVTIQLPASPSQGDIVGIKVVGASNANLTASFPDPAYTIDGVTPTGPGAGWSIKDVTATLDYVVLNYVGGSVGWAVIFGEIVATGS
jgi:hypothetical protein